MPEIFGTRGTDGVANLRVISDYALEGAAPAYWFELHLAIELRDDARARAPEKADTLSQLLRSGDLHGAGEFILENGEIAAATRANLSNLLRTIYQTPLEPQE